MENRINRWLRFTVAEIFQESAVSRKVAIDGNIISVYRQFRTHAVLMLVVLTGRANLAASLHNLSATSDVLV